MLLRNVHFIPFNLALKEYIFNDNNNTCERDAELSRLSKNFNQTENIFDVIHMEIIVDSWLVRCLVFMSYNYSILQLGATKNYESTFWWNW